MPPFTVHRTPEGFQIEPESGAFADLPALAAWLGEAEGERLGNQGLPPQERDKLMQWIGALALARTRRVNWSPEDYLQAALMVAARPNAARAYESKDCARTLRELVHEEGLDALRGRAVMDGAVMFIPDSLLDHEIRMEREEVERHWGDGAAYRNCIQRLYGSREPGDKMMSWISMTAGRLATAEETARALAEQQPQQREHIERHFPDLVHLAEPLSAQVVWERVRERV